MSKILIVGTGPLLSKDSKYSQTDIFRTHHITQPLRDVGHAVDLVVLSTEDFVPGAEPDGQITNARYDSMNYSIIHSRDEKVCCTLLQQMHDAKEFDAIIAVGFQPAVISSQIITNLPIWSDLTYCPVSRAQTTRDNHKVYEAAVGLKKILNRADRISVASFKHMCAVQGQLGLSGRFNDKNPEHPFVTILPLAGDPTFFNVDLPISVKKFRGSTFPEDAYAVLWSGAYEPWTDPKALAGALSLAMEQLPKMHFISTGGVAPGADETVYNVFREEMRKTGFIDRCVFLDWIPLDQLAQLCCECDLGLNLESLNYDTLLGSRSRIVNMMSSGLCVLSTLGTEQSELLADNRLGYTTRIGKIQEFSDALVRGSRFPNERRQLGIRARSFVKENLQPSMVVRGLLKWATAPVLAPDNEEKLKMAEGGALKSVIYTKFDAENRALADGALQELASLKRQMEKMETESALRSAESGTKIFDLIGKIRRKFNAD